LRQRPVSAGDAPPLPVSCPVKQPVRSVAKSARAPEAPPPLAPLERRTRQKLARGRDRIERRIDLHGMTQAEAHAALRRFLFDAQASDAKYVLVVTGKGRAQEHGVLRRQVPLWLALPEFRALVVGFDTANRGHGGEGALYVRVRKRRRATK
jgi:DNA-nicking Smr family endonuclease